MALTTNDLKKIREIFIDGFESLADPRFDTLETNFEKLHESDSVHISESRETNRRLGLIEGQVQALEADIRQIYIMLAKQQADAPSFNKLTLEQKILSTYEQLKLTAKEAGVRLEA